MAFGVQQPLDYNKDISTLDIAQLSGQVQTALQQRFDVNTAKMEEMIQKVSSIPLVQDASKKYLYDRVQGALDLVNGDLKATQGRGLLSSTTTSRLGKYVQSSIDDTVKKHMQFSQSVVNFETTVSDLKKKDPKTYSQNNYEFAKYQAGYDAYLKGDVNSSLGSLQYTPYRDVMDNAMKKAKEYKDLQGEQTIEIIMPDGRKQVRTIKGLSSEEIINFVPGFLSSEDEKQIAIDGWGMVKNSPDKGVGQLTDYYNTKIEKNNSMLAELKAKNSTNSSASELKDVNLKIAQIEGANTTISEYIKNVADKRPEEIGYILNRQNLVNSMATLFAGRESVKYEVDDHWKTMEEFRRDDRKYELDVMKFNAELAKEGKKLNSSTGQVENTGSLEGVSRETYSDQEVGEMSGEVIYDQAVKALEGTNETMKSILSREFNALPSQEARDIFVNQMKKNGYELTPDGTDFVRKSGTISKASALNSSYLKVRDLNYGNPAIEVEMADLEAIRLQQQKSIQEAKAEAAKDEDLSFKETLAKKIQAPLALAKGASENSNPGVKLGVYLLNKGINTVGLNAEEAQKKGSKEKIGSILKNKPGVASLFDQYDVVISGTKKEEIINGINPSEVKGDKFDPKGGSISARYDKATNQYRIIQYKGLKGSGDKRSGEYAEVYITRNEGSDLARKLDSFINIDKNVDYYDSKNMPENVPLRSYKPGTISDTEDETKHKIMMETIATATAGDVNMANSLLGFSSKIRANKVLSEALVNKGLSEEEANAMASRIISRTLEGEITVDLVPTKYGWQQRVLVDGVPTIQKHVGDGTLLSKRENSAIKLLPAQSAMLSIYNTLNDPRYSIEDVTRIYGGVFK